MPHGGYMKTATQTNKKSDFEDLLQQIQKIVHTEIQQEQESPINAPFWRSKTAAFALGVTHPTFLAWVRDGKMPAGYKLSEGVIVWDKDEVLAAVKQNGKRQSRTAVAV